MRKYSIVRASANELGGTMQTSVFKSTNDRGSNAFGSITVLLMFVNTLNSSATGMPSITRRPRAAIPRPTRTRILPTKNIHHRGHRGLRGKQLLNRYSAMVLRVLRGGEFQIRSTPAKKYPISNAAVSAASDPC